MEEITHLIAIRSLNTHLKMINNKKLLKLINVLNIIKPKIIVYVNLHKFLQEKVKKIKINRNLKVYMDLLLKINKMYNILLIPNNLLYKLLINKVTKIYNK